MTKVTITLQDGEFIARHLDHVGIIGVGDTEQEALQELAEALGELAFRVTMKDELLDLYIQKENLLQRGYNGAWPQGTIIEYEKLCEGIIKIKAELE